ncbi:MAG: hypothetical protein JXQ23_04360 [Clostridia bacterium]|nr:hypothetical protein [Clostridia bacterium]
MTYDVTKEIYLTDKNCDYLSKLKMSQAFILMQDVAEKSAVSAGMGREEMIKDNRSFVLSRMTLEVTRMPDIYETFTLLTWPKGMMKMFYLRDYLFSKGDEPLIKARAVWAVLDLKTRKLVVDKKGTAIFDIDEKRASLDYVPGKIRSDEPGEFVGEVNATYSLTDPNGHINNTRYIEWIYDYLPDGFLEKHISYRVDINYINEAYYKDKIKIYCFSGENIIIEGRVSDKVCFLAQFSKLE